MSEGVREDAGLEAKHVYFDGVAVFGFRIDDHDHAISSALFERTGHDGSQASPIMGWLDFWDQLFVPDYCPADLGESG